MVDMAGLATTGTWPSPTLSRMAGLPDELVLPIPGRQLLCMC
ncbi:hypothetical protein CGCA056_v012374 [Colletotrichum aenigma]|nr:uncharacterized protein CGCA056_v012374 [Colletotrichum aenigma]KAF5513055.1 hypothetical protein CGCA056_v012374 [Colletotrichum aenigma]